MDTHYQDLKSVVSPWVTFVEFCTCLFFVATAIVNRKYVTEFINGF
jgi:hypothetical protein